MAASNLKIRLAQTRDIDAITALICDSMDDNPLFTYRYPGRRQFPEDLYAAVRATTRSAVNDDTIIVNVATFIPPFLDEDDDFPAAVAVWHSPAALAGPSTVSRTF